ncbi:LysR family substrate-binding domain-containing protein [Yinghuangia sp. ASG 101]|uniref:LysR family substrate-binding domain-containing protein n=1 Tax=Yinghuangia sp. ASG 101 TaxID=2896848 RepID=UPI001E3D58EC|nr:LysR family substrate-binding domain-containing protein [Yinghuangia sp. ASG 101]UGQ13337.1 LysR family substrate-binding domain-containing protein [Yinghuangia sp. ASG 101]
MTSSDSPRVFRLAYVPGATPAKWVRIWSERLPDVPLTLVAVPPADAARMLRERVADAGLVRLPLDRTDLSAIPLYTETTVAVVPKDHLVTAADEITTADLADEIVLHPLDDTLPWESPPGLPAVARPDTTSDAIELVAAGVGVLLVPQSLARLHHRRDVTYRPVTDAPQSRVALAWPEDATTDLVEEFIGIVRGRTVNSSRGRTAQRAGTPDATAKHGKSGKSGQGADGPKPGAKPHRTARPGASRGPKRPGRGRRS